MGTTTQTKFLLALTIIIAVGSIATIFSVLQSQNILSNIDRVQVFLEDNEIQTNMDNDPIIMQTIIQETPLDFEGSTQDQISQFLELIGLTVTETVNIEASIELLDANQESELQSAFVRIQPLDPQLILVEGFEVAPERLFVNTDFATQLSDNGLNHHKFSGWDIIRAGNVGINVFIGGCSGIENNNGKCVGVDGARNVDDDVHNFSTFYGIVKDIVISDWTQEGELILRFDYSCSQLTRATIFATVKGDSEKTFQLTCQTFASFEQDVSDVAGTSNVLRVKIGGSAGNPDRFAIRTMQINNVQVEGNSVAIREAIETLQGIGALSIEGITTGQILDLGFIVVELEAITINPNQRIVLDGDLEVRVNDQTVSSHIVTANGRTDENGRIPLSIEGSPTFVLQLDENNFDEGFNTIKLLINDVSTNVGDIPNVRTFEYHIPFVLYILDFNVLPDEILAFDQQNQAISIKINDSTFTACGLSAGENFETEETIFPPVVRIVDNGFTIATTNPQAGIKSITNSITGLVAFDTEFCSTVPELPRDSQLTFVIEDEFIIVDTPAFQKNLFVKCTRNGCSSNIGFESSP